MLLQQYLHDAARLWPQQEALVADGLRLSHAQVLGAARRLARALHEAGVSQGDRVLLFMDNGVLLATAIWAVLEAGAVVVPVHVSTKAERLHKLVADAQPKAMLIQPALAAVAQAALREAPSTLPVWLASLTPAVHTAGQQDTWPTWTPDWATNSHDQGPVSQGLAADDLAALIYTSGSTGEPKGVMLSHRSMRAACRAILDYLPLRQGDRVLCALPLCFSYGLYHVFLGAAQGATLHIERSFAFPVKMAALMQQERISVFPAVPTMYAMLLSLNTVGDGDWSHLRVLTNAGSALPMAQASRLAQLWPQAQLFNMYGQTECARISYLPPEDLMRKAGSVGKGLSGQTWWLADENGQPLDQGQTGELIVSGEHVMLGYWRQPEATQAKLWTDPGTGLRVLRTGDLFRTDKDGYLYFVGRQDDIIKSRGEKVSPREVEETIHLLPGVRQAAVVGVDDALLGQAIRAFIVTEPGASLSEREVIRHCLGHLESFKSPQTVVFVDALPHTESGKLLKRALLSNHTSPAP